MHALVVVHATTGLDVVLVADTVDTTVPQISVSAHAPVTATPVASRRYRVTSFNGVISTVALMFPMFYTPIAVDTDTPTH